MIGFLLQQAHLFVVTKFRHFFMHSLDTFLFHFAKATRWDYFIYNPLPSDGSDWVYTLGAYGILKPSNSAFVSKVEYMKCTSGVQHEFLLCHLTESHPGPENAQHPRESVVLIDRTMVGKVSKANRERTAEAGIKVDANNNGASPQMAQDTPRSPPPTPRVSSDTDVQSRRSARYIFAQAVQFSSSSSPGGQSGDRMLFSRTGDAIFATSVMDHPYTVKGKFTLRPDRFTLSQLVTLFNAVHLTFELYSVEEHNCYWFGITIYKSIMDIAGLTSKEKDDASPKGVGALVLGGKVKIYTLPSRWSLREFVVAYNKEWKEAKTKIDAIREEAERPIKEEREARQQEREARQKAEDARQKAEADAQKERDARQKAEDDARKAKDDARKAKEDVRKEMEARQQEMEARQQERNAADEKIKRLEAELSRVRKPSGQSTAGSVTKQRSS